KQAESKPLDERDGKRISKKPKDEVEEIDDPQAEIDRLRKRAADDRARKSKNASNAAGVVDETNDNPTISRLMSALRSEHNVDRIRAANELAKLGQAAKSAARALCAAATDEDGEVRQSAIEALEKVHPALA